MYGILIPDETMLTKEEIMTFRAYYCALCRAIGVRYGTVPRAALRYDTAFLYMTVSLLRGEKAPGAPGRCLLHPFRRGDEPETPSFSAQWAADVSILLAYRKLEDDVLDAHSAAARLGMRLLGQAYAAAAASRPAADAAIRTSMETLRDMERRGEPDPDKPAGCFGALAGKLLSDAVPENGNGGTAARDAETFGTALGRAVYLFDAAADLEDDLKHLRYNPFTFLPSGSEEALLEDAMAAVCGAFDALAAVPLVSVHRNLYDSVFLSGIWTEYRAKKGQHREKEERQEKRGKAE